MFWLKKNKEPDRFYLLPGQGWLAYRRKQLVFLRWAVIAALIVSAVLTVLLYCLNLLGPH
jgi:hypothetical protein